VADKTELSRLGIGVWETQYCREGVISCMNRTGKHDSDRVCLQEYFEVRRDFQMRDLQFTYKFVDVGEMRSCS
jgi:hypothetical protein